MVTRDSGFLLRRYNFRETSLITVFYTRAHGKISGLLKGFYTQKKEFTTSLNIFTLNELVFYPKKRDLWLVSFADQIRDYPYLRKSYVKCLTATLFTTIIDKIMSPWDVHPEIFDLLRVCLEILGEEDELKILEVFLIKLLSLSGFEPEFTRCLRCHNPMGERVYFSVTRGGLLCDNCTAGAVDAQYINKDISSSIKYIQQTDLDKVLRLRTSSTCEKGIFYILREFILYHLDIDIMPGLNRVVSHAHKKAN